MMIMRKNYQRIEYTLETRGCVRGMIALFFLFLDWLSEERRNMFVSHISLYDSSGLIQAASDT